MAAEATLYWIMVLDIESFSTRTDPIQKSLRAAMYEVLREALAQADLPERDIVVADRGDGVLMLVPPTVSPVRLAGALIRAFDDGLGQKAAIFSAAHAMRFRIALHQGLAAPDGQGWSGDAVNAACRLVDAQPLREVLKAAESAHLAFIVSDEVYRGVIRHGHRTIDPAAYLPLTFEAKGGVDFRSWVYVPGYSAPPGLPAAAGDRPGPEGGAAPAAPGEENPARSNAQGAARDTGRSTEGGSGRDTSRSTGGSGRDTSRSTGGSGQDTGPSTGGSAQGSDQDPPRSGRDSAGESPQGPAPGTVPAPGVIQNVDVVHGDVVARDKVVTVHTQGPVRL
ncbi:hypothetical protein [Streptomyces sp. 8N706]|uniref:hypothetical protein n=1 Tax=Streptomyces sp. 8N706 TaxID=3457416 RepID=UPI003FD5EE34